jgi:hypothetical protein
MCLLSCEAIMSILENQESRKTGKETRGDSGYKTCYRK